MKIVVISAEEGFDEFEHFGEDAVDFFDLLFLVFFFEDFILEAAGLNHGDFPHFDHGDGLANKFDVFDGELVGFFAKEVEHTHEGLADNFLFVHDHFEGGVLFCLDELLDDDHLDEEVVVGLGYFEVDDPESEHELGEGLWAGDG